MSKKPYVIAIAGPSGSGKSEVCKYLQKEIGDVLCMSIDDYFRDPNELSRIGEWKNSDVPEAIRFDRLVKDLEALKSGQEITTSVFKYPHESWERTEKQLKPADFIIIEGFLILYDERVGDVCDLKIFIDVPEELQFERRIRRNPKENEEYIKQVVIPNYKIYGLPTKQYANVVIDGSKPLAEVVQEVKRVIESRL